MKNYRIDVYIVDDHTMLNEGLTDAVNRSKTIYVSRSFTTLAECRTALRERRPDVLLLDISMPDGDGTAFLPMGHRGISQGEDSGCHHPR